MSLRFWEKSEEVVVYAAQAYAGLAEAATMHPVRVVSVLPAHGDYIVVLGAEEPLHKAIPKHIPVIDAGEPELGRRISEAILYIKAHKAISE